jgi:hypothetical protein
MNLDVERAWPPLKSSRVYGLPEIPVSAMPSDTQSGRMPQKCPIGQYASARIRALKILALSNLWMEEHT